MKTTASVLALTLSALAGAIASSNALAGETEFRVFDVRLLVRKVEDRPGPRFSLFQAGAVRRDITLDWDVGMEEDHGAVMGEEELKMSIQRLDPSVEWEGEGLLLRSMHGRLFVRHTPEVLARVAAYLKTLEETASRTVLVRAWVFGRTLEGSISGGELDGAQAAGIVRRLETGKEWWEEMTVTALVGQRAFATKGTQFLHLAELDPEVAQEAGLHDPVMAVGDSGVVLDVRTQVSPSGKSFTLTVRLSCARPLEEGSIRTISTPGGRIQVPALRNTSLQATVTIPAGKALLLGTSKPSSGDLESREDGGVRLLLTAETCRGASSEKKDGR